MYSSIKDDDYDECEGNDDEDGYEDGGPKIKEKAKWKDEEVG